MATIKVQLNQSDDGLNLVVTDYTQWADSSNTGVTHSKITIQRRGEVTVYTVVDDAISQPAAYTDLTWTIPSSDCGFGATQPFADDVYNIIITYTTSPASDPVNSNVLLDYNTKYYKYQIIYNLPIDIANNDFKYNKDVEKYIVFDVLLFGVQSAATVGQLTRVDNILGVIENFKLQNFYDNTII